MATIVGAFSSIVNVASGVVGNPLALAGIVPLIAVGMTVFRYTAVDPETHPNNVQYVRDLKKQIITFDLHFEFYVCSFYQNMILL